MTLFIGLAITAAVAFFLGFITLRMGGHYLPLGTIAWGISLYFLFGNVEFLGGHTGITGIPAVSLFGWSLKSGREFYYLIWLILLLAILGIRNLLDSRSGRAIRALKGGAVMAEAMGVDTARAKIVIFLIAALLASVSGWLYAHLQRFVNPTPFCADAGHRIPVHGRRRRRRPCLGRRAWGRADHPPQAVAAGLAATTVRPERQFRDHRLRHRHGAGAATRPRRPVAGDPAAVAGARGGA